MSDHPLTTKELADRLGVSPRRIRLIAREEGIGTKVGGIWLFTRSEYDQLVQDRISRKSWRMTNPPVYANEVFGVTPPGPSDPQNDA